MLTAIRALTELKTADVLSEGLKEWLGSPSDGTPENVLDLWRYIEFYAQPLNEDQLKVVTLNHKEVRQLVSRVSSSLLQAADPANFLAGAERAPTRGEIRVLEKLKGHKLQQLLGLLKTETDARLIELAQYVAIRQHGDDRGDDAWLTMDRSFRLLLDAFDVDFRMSLSNQRDGREGGPLSTSLRPTRLFMISRVSVAGRKREPCGGAVTSSSGRATTLAEIFDSDSVECAIGGGDRCYHGLLGRFDMIYWEPTRAMSRCFLPKCQFRGGDIGGLLSRLPYFERMEHGLPFRLPSAGGGAVDGRANKYMKEHLPLVAVLSILLSERSARMDFLTRLLMACDTQPPEDGDALRQTLSRACQSA